MALYNVMALYHIVHGIVLAALSDSLYCTAAYNYAWTKLIDKLIVQCHVLDGCIVSHFQGCAFKPGDGVA